MKYLFNAAFIIIISNDFLLAQTLFFNCKIFTADSNQSELNYFTVQDGKFLDVGYSNDIQNQFNNKIDLEGKTILPGFVDSHIHFIDGALGLIQTNLEDAISKNELKARLNNTKQNLLEGIYVARNLGFGTVKDIGSPLQFLDSIFSETPAVIFMKSGHAAMANTTAMKKLNFSSDTKIENGEMATDIDGNLNGWLFEAAAMTALKEIGNFYSQKTLVDAVLSGQEKLLSYGITTIGDNTFVPYNLKIYQSLQTSGLLKIRIWARSYGRIPQTTDLMSSLGVKKLGFIGPTIDFNKIHFHATKYFEDMSLSVPEGSPDISEPGGKIFISKDELIDIFLLNPQNTFAFHVQGKHGLKNILDALEFSKDRILLQRNVIDHVGYATIDQLNEIKELKQSTTIIASQVFDYPRIIREYSHSKSPLIDSDLMNNKLKYNIDKAALTSDYPYGMDTTFMEYQNIDGLNPLPNIAVNVCGKYPDGNIINGFENKTLTIPDAIKSYTTNGAFVLGLEEKVGKIKPGYYADFIVIDKDIVKSEPIKLYNAKVEQTFISGEKVFDINRIMNYPTIRNSTDAILPYNYSISPIFGYDPILGFFFGGAGFIFPLQTPNNYYDLQFMYSLNNRWSIAANYKRYGLTSSADLSASGGYSNFSQYYFGELDTTAASNYREIHADNYFVHLNFEEKITQHFKVNLLAELRGRKENYYTDKNDKKFSDQLFPDERAIAFGLEPFIDNRNDPISTKNGYLLKLGLEYIPDFLNYPYRTTFLLIYSEGRYFNYIYNAHHVIALRASAGMTIGESTYLYRYNFGGTNQLRGYYTNRFRSDKYLIGQVEYRWQFIKRFSTVIFSDAGYVNEKLFNRLLSTWGFGLRFFINSNAILRFDYGFGKDQNGLFFTFGEAF